MRVPGLLSTLMTCAVIAAGPTSAQSLEVGQPFPEIVLPSLDGEPMSISSFRGTKIAMHVWASW